MSTYAGVRVLVTGAHGFLGRHLCRALTQEGAVLSTPTRAEANLLDQQAVLALVAAERPELVFHLAAACGGIAANVANPGRFLYENALMGLLLLEACRQNGAKLVLVSTTCAYPQDAPLPLQEDSLWAGPPTGATGPYGMAKRLLHEALATYHRQYGQRGNVLLLSNLYGPEDHFDPETSHVVPALIRRFVEAKEADLPAVTNWGTGQATREFLHVADAVRALLLAGRAWDEVRPVNIGTGIETSIRALTEQIASLVGYRGALSWDPTKPDGQPRRFLNVSRAQALGFNANVSLADGLAETIQWFTTHRK